MSDPAASSAPGEDSGVPVVWIVVFAVVFLGLIASMVALISSDHLPARFVDVEQTTLVPRKGGTRLHLVLRHAPRHGQLAQRVELRDDGIPVVTIELSATGQPAPQEGEDDRRSLDIDLPDVDRVQVVDLRFGRDEAVEIRRSDGPTP